MKSPLALPATFEAPVHPELSLAEQRENTEFIIQAAGRIAQKTQTEMEHQAASDPLLSKYKDEFYQNVESGRRVTRNYSLHEPGVWLGETVWAIAQGRRTVVTLPEYGMATYTDEEGNHKVDTAHSNFDHLTCVIGGVLRAVRPPHHQMQLTYPITDTIDPATGRQFSHRTRTKFQQHIDGSLRGHGAVFPEDTYGRDYNLPLLSLSELHFRKRLLPGLRQSDWGELDEPHNGSKWFKPTEELLDILPTKLSPQERKTYQKHGVPISVYGETSHEALLAAQVAWRSANPGSVRLSITDREGNKRANEQFMILKALGLTHLERFHRLAIPLGLHEFSLAFPQYALSRRIQKHAERFLESFDAYDNFESFDPYEYAGRNYGEILTDDKNLCMLTMFAMQFLGIKNARAADIGCGPNLYPAMLLEPHSRTIDLLEYSPSNREFLDRWFGGTLPPELQSIFEQFADLMRDKGGSAYNGVTERLVHGHQNGRVMVNFGDNFALPENEWDLITNSFVGDSIIFQKLLFPTTVRRMGNALTPEGVLISAYMLNEPDHNGYNAGEGKKFPNISQTTQEIHNTYVDNGLVPIVIPTAGPEKFREGYHGMAFVVAAKQGSAKAQKIKELARPLHEFAQAGFERIPQMS